MTFLFEVRGIFLIFFSEESSGISGGTLNLEVFLVFSLEDTGSGSGIWGLCVQNGSVRSLRVDCLCSLIYLKAFYLDNGTAIARNLNEDGLLY